MNRGEMVIKVESCMSKAGRFIELSKLYEDDCKKEELEEYAIKELERALYLLRVIKVKR